MTFVFIQELEATVANVTGELDIARLDIQRLEEENRGLRQQGAQAEVPPPPRVRVELPPCIVPSIGVHPLWSETQL